MGTVSYSEFRQALFDRHQHPATSALSTVGDALPAVGIALAVVKRDRRWAFGGLLSGVAAASIAHLFQPGTLVSEYAGIVRHPVWAVRAERDRVLGRRDE